MSRVLDAQIIAIAEGLQALGYTFGGGSSNVEQYTLAERPPAAPSFAKKLAIVSDLDGRKLQYCTGDAWVDAAPGVSQGVMLIYNWADLPSTPSARAAAGIYAGTELYVRDPSWNNQFVKCVWDGTYYAPAGLQTLYRLTAPIAGNTGTTSTADIPEVAVPAKLMGLNFKVEAYLEAEANQTPTQHTWTQLWDGSDMAGTQGANRRLIMRRRIRNYNDAQIQYCSAKGNSEAGGVILDNNNSQSDRTKNTNNNLVMGSGASAVIATHATSIQTVIRSYEVTWGF